MDLTLTRYAYLPTVTLGRLRAGSLVLFTLERPWIANPDGPGGKPRESCVPDGGYTVRPHDSEKFPGTYALTNGSLGVYYQQRPDGQTWGRTAILIHAGNRVADVIGCIAVGRSYRLLEGTHAVLDSRRALEELRELLGRDDVHSLTIRPTGGTEELDHA